MVKTYAYWNLHRGCVSLVEGSRGKVRHADAVAMRDVEFRVRQAGRRRVLEEGRKNVHAFVVGDVLSEVPDTTEWRRAYYNPYNTDRWVDAETREPINSADLAVVRKKTVYYKGEKK